MRAAAVAIRPTGWSVLRGIKWSRTLGASLVLVVAALLVQPPVQHTSAVPTKADPALFAQATAAPDAQYSVIVREAQPGSAAAEDLVRSLGGHVTQKLSIIGGFSATVSGSAVRSLTSSPLVWRVWGDAHLQPQNSSTDKYDAVAANTVWKDTIQLGKAQQFATGAGVGVAVVDTGVVPVPDLAGHITHVVDLTAEHDGMDRYGHGTHMAGIIAGQGISDSRFAGVAPGANLISVKVAGLDGSTDVSIVMAGLQWVVTHRAQYNIKVVNLSFGTDSQQPYSIDPLDYAVEQVWRSGVLVVASAGNRGADGVSKPGDDPYVVTVGAADLKNTYDWSDDAVASFSSRGPTPDGFAKPDLVAPGTTIVSARDVGSVVDVQHPSAVVGANYFKGTGTSQAAAMVSGVAALVYQANPNYSPDQVKGVLVGTASGLSGQAGAGAGLVQAASAVKTNKSYSVNQGLTPSTGLGSLEASRGSLHVYVMRCDTVTGACAPVMLSGELDALGNAWSGNAWSGNAWSGNAWSTVAFEGNAWSGNAWSGNAWSGNAWSGNAWSGNAWSGNAWSGNAWSGEAWS